MPRKQEPLRLGKGAAFVKRRLKRLRQEDETWEADFRALPKPPTQSDTHYLGMVVTEQDGYLLAESEVINTPSVNDLATLLANAMSSPLVHNAHRPNHVQVRGHHQWRELFPHLNDLGIEVSVQKELATIDKAYSEHLQQLRKARRAGMLQPTEEQRKVEQLFPAIAKWVDGYGHIEIGDQEMFGFVVRALDYGGMPFEDDKPDTLAEAMASLEKALKKWFEEQGETVD